MISLERDSWQMGVVVAICAVLVIVIFLKLLWKLTDRFLTPLFDTAEAHLQDAQGEYQRLVNIDGAKSWSSDDRFLRIHQIKRALNPDSGGSIKLILLNTNNRNQLEDSLITLERIAKRNDGDDTPPETIIGYERD